MDSFLELENNNLSQVPESDGYSRQRLSPRRSNPAYLHLVELREALNLHKTSEKISIFDYGLWRLSLPQPFSRQPHSRNSQAGVDACGSPSYE
jgi:hypothetical protein